MQRLCVREAILSLRRYSFFFFLIGHPDWPVGAQRFQWVLEHRSTHGIGAYVGDHLLIVTPLVKPTYPPKVPSSAPVWQQPLEKPHSSPEFVAAPICWADHDPWWPCYSSIEKSGLAMWPVLTFEYECVNPRYWDEQNIKRSKINRRLGNRNDITRDKHTHISIKGDHISAKQWKQEVWRHINLHRDAWF